MLESTSSKMLYRELGSTGERVFAIGLGGWHIGVKHIDEELGIRIVRTAIERGITFMDNSETRIVKILGLQRHLKGRERSIRR